MHGLLTLQGLKGLFLLSWIGAGKVKTAAAIDNLCVSLSWVRYKQRLQLVAIYSACYASRIK